MLSTARLRSLRQLSQHDGRMPTGNCKLAHLANGFHVQVLAFSPDSHGLVAIGSETKGLGIDAKLKE
jgi:hypothetical protein